MLICKLNKCKCPNGTPVDDYSCPKNGGIHCASCEGDKNLHLGYTTTWFKRQVQQITCQPNQCECPNGVPVDTKQCTKRFIMYVNRYQIKIVFVGEKIIGNTLYCARSNDV